MQSKNQLRRELISAVNNGLEAESAAKFLIPVLQRRKDSLINSLCNSSLDYQKIDNHYYYALHLELRLLTEMQSDIETAITNVNEARSTLGAQQNRLEHTINNLGTTTENLVAAESRIRDVDMASEMMEMTKNNILAQAAQAMIAQANQQPQSVLQLLR